MNLRMEHGVYLALAFVGVVFFILLSFMGPVGWIFDVLFVLAVLKLAELERLLPSGTVGTET